MLPFFIGKNFRSRLEGDGLGLASCTSLEQLHTEMKATFCLAASKGHLRVEIKWRFSSAVASTYNVKQPL